MEISAVDWQSALRIAKSALRIAKSFLKIFFWVLLNYYTIQYVSSRVWLSGHPAVGLELPYTRQEAL
jgi:hypothetical protein